MFEWIKSSFIRLLLAGHFSYSLHPKKSAVCVNLQFLSPLYNPLVF